MKTGETFICWLQNSWGLNLLASAMAIWQDGFHIIPRGSVGLLIVQSFTIQEDFDDEIFWKVCQLKQDRFFETANILKKAPSWSPKIDLFGNL